MRGKPGKKNTSFNTQFERAWLYKTQQSRDFDTYWKEVYDCLNRNVSVRICDLTIGARRHLHKEMFMCDKIHGDGDSY